MWCALGMVESALQVHIIIIITCCPRDCAPFWNIHEGRPRSQARFGVIESEACWDGWWMQGLSDLFRILSTRTSWASQMDSGENNSNVATSISVRLRLRCESYHFLVRCCVVSFWANTTQHNTSQRWCVCAHAYTIHVNPGRFSSFCRTYYPINLLF